MSKLQHSFQLLRHLSRKFTFLASSLLLIFAGCTQKKTANTARHKADTVISPAAADNKRSLKEIMAEQHLSSGDIHLKVYKGRKLLVVMHRNKTLKTFPVVLGSNSDADKLMEGDRLTPEGTFKIASKYPHKKWQKFMWINYPTADSRRKHRKAKQQGIIPDSARIGGEIGIHGVPHGSDYLIDEKINWTLGCISLKNKDINELYEAIAAGTSLIISK